MKLSNRLRRDTAGSGTLNWASWTPGLFVLIWSTGFIVAKFGLPYAPPLTFLLLRFAAVLCVLLPLVLVARAPWPRGRIRHVAIAGIFLHAGYLGGVWCAIALGMPAGLSALIVGLQPVLTALSASWIGEGVGRKQWLGMALGFCGVALVVSDKLSVSGLSLPSILLCVAALVSITVGTLYQKKYCAAFDLRTGTVIQFAASLAVVLPFAVAFEGLNARLSSVSWTPQFIAALAWAVVALSIGAIFLLFALIRRRAATHVTSLLYLTPPTTALMAWAAFGEALTLGGLCGMALAVCGVALVVRK